MVLRCSWSDIQIFVVQCIRLGPFVCETTADIFTVVCICLFVGWLVVVMFVFVLCLSMCLFICLSMCLFTFLSCVCVCFAMCLFSCLFTCLFTCLSINFVNINTDSVLIK